MGLLVSRFKSKKSTIEVLEDIDKDINRLQKNRKQNQERQKKIVTSLLIYSIAAYVLSAIIFFVYYFPDTWKLRFLYCLPLLIFPLLIWGLKKLLHWYFVKRIASNDGELLKLREQKKQILEDVMETETYKKAREILEKFDPIRFRKLEALPEAATSPSATSGTPGTVIHQRSGAIRPAGARPGMIQQTRQIPVRTPVSTPRMPVPQPRLQQPTPTPVKTSTPYPTTPNLPPRYPLGQPLSAGPRQPQPQQPPGSVTRQLQQHQQQQQQAVMGNTPMVPRGYAMPPGPPMPRTILPQQRGTMDRLMDYLVGDGPENRYALICERCFSHNGMALKEEFEYLAFRCCYCYHLNPARKQRPMAPRLEFFAPRGRNPNTDSQGSAASDEDSDDEEDGDSGEEEAGSRQPPSSRADNDTPARNVQPRPGAGRGQGGQARDGDAERTLRGPDSATAVNRSSNAVAATSMTKQPSSPARRVAQQQRPAPSQPMTKPTGEKKFPGVVGAVNTPTQPAAKPTGEKKFTGVVGVANTPSQPAAKLPSEKKSENFGFTGMEAKGKITEKLKSKVKLSPSLPNKATETQGERSGQQKSISAKSGADEQNVEQKRSQTSAVETGVVDSEGCTDFVIVSSPLADGGDDETDIPFIDGGGLVTSPPLPKAEEDSSSFISATTEDQTEAFTSITSETDIGSNESASLADHVNLTDYPQDSQGGNDESGESQQDGQDRGPTLSEEIRDSVQSLLSSSAMAAEAGGDDRDGGSAHFNEGDVFTNTDREQAQALNKDPVEPSE
ncbi:protein lunapark-like [Elysia marginata]|uniref:Endoplasmic reticulum junction formation protein lunapark n=1 Tax=Elysia marginata TaxID=1093978 RepID=A0AAV4HRB8_9GAST|nr:protein lunapark-like [Elysia marginata]